MNVVYLESVDSTNNYVKEHTAELEDGTMVCAADQTSGRGQRGNSWESEPGKNLTFSVLARLKNFPARLQFAVSEAVAVSVAAALGTFGIAAKVKWPNDIYVGDRKICGILIEQSVMGSELTQTIIGVGLNVNQTEFHSDAPNPVSMAMASEKEFSLEGVRQEICRHLDMFLKVVETEPGRKVIHNAFLHDLWRGDGKPYRFRERESGEEFTAVIADVEPEGRLILARESGEADGRPEMKGYYFKEVEFIL